MARQQLGLFSKQQPVARDASGPNIRIYDDYDVILPAEMDLEREADFPGIIEADDQFELIDNWADFEKVCDDLKVAQAIAHDTETEGLGKLRHQIIGYSFSYRKDFGPFANVEYDQLRNVYIPVRHRTGEPCLDPKKVSEALVPIFERTDCLWLFWNPKYDWHMDQNEGLVAPHPCLDGMILRQLIYADRLAGLKHVATEDIDPEAARAEKLLKIYVTVVCRLNRWKKPKDNDPVGRAYYEYITTSIMAAYAARDTFFTWIATAHYLSRVAAVPALLDLAVVEHVLLDPLYEMEREGLYVSRERVDKNSLELDRLMKEMEDKISEMYAKEINLGSGDQVAAMFKEMGVPILKATKETKKLPEGQQLPSLDADSLMRLNKKGHEIAGHVHKWRKARDLKSKYLNVLPRIAEKDDCVHASFKQVGTESGRLCVAGDTLLETDKGTFEISELDISQDLSILTHMNQYRPILNKYYKGKEQMYKVVLDNGSFIKCTAGHRVLTRTDWRRLDELIVGSDVCTPGPYFPFIAESDRLPVISEITPIGIEDVWDIEVEEDHSYVAQGFINHNSSGGPNMQNFPSRGKLAHLVKGVFIIPPHLQKDWVWVFADLSQIEVRILTHYCQEPSLVEGYLHGLDIHAATAEAMFGDQWDNADAKERKMLRSIGKQLNFSIVYGVGPKGLSDILFKGDGFDPGIDASEEECKDFIERYMTARPMVISWIERTRREGRKTGVILNAQGRRREFFELLDPQTPMKVITAIERELTNFVIQGSAADMYKKGVALSYLRFKHEGLRVKYINTIHDEIQYLVHRQDLLRSAQIVKVSFEKDAAPWCSTPIVMDFEYAAGSDMAWSDKKDLTPEIIESLSKAA